jgi:hypothetical protein
MVPQAPAVVKKEDEVRSLWRTAFFAHAAAIGCASTDRAGVFLLLPVVVCTLSAAWCLLLVVRCML